MASKKRKARRPSDADQAEPRTEVVPDPATLPRRSYRHTLSGGVGRPTFCSPGVIEAVANIVAIGVPLKTALRALRIPHRTAAEWSQWGRRDEELGLDSPYAEWWLAVKEARAVGEITLVGKVVSAADEDYRAAAWLLERQFGDRYRATQKVQITGKDGKDLQALPPEQLIALANKSVHLPANTQAETKTEQQEDPDVIDEV